MVNLTMTEECFKMDYLFCSASHILGLDGVLRTFTTTDKFIYLILQRECEYNKPSHITIEEIGVLCGKLHRGTVTDSMRKLMSCGLVHGELTRNDKGNKKWRFDKVSPFVYDGSLVISVDNSSTERLLPEGPKDFFVYKLIKGADIIYIGQTTLLKNRIKQHACDKDFDKFSFVMVDSFEDMLKLESHLIRKYSPPLNKCYVRGLAEAGEYLEDKYGVFREDVYCELCGKCRYLCDCNYYTSHDDGQWLRKCV